MSTPFTYIESFTSVDCRSTPLTWTEWRTAYVNGTPYPGNTETITLQFSNTEVTYTFSNLILNILQPGDEITMV